MRDQLQCILASHWSAYYMTYYMLIIGHLRRRESNSITQFIIFDLKGKVKENFFGRDFFWVGRAPLFIILVKFIF